MDVLHVSYYFEDAFFALLSAPTPSSKNTMLIVFRSVPDLPRPNGRARLRTVPLSTVIFLTYRFSSEDPRLRAFASAESKSFSIAGEDFLDKKASSARASPTDLPRMRSATRRTLRGDWW